VLHGAAQAQETIKIGVLGIDAGPFALYSASVTEGVTLAVETLNAQGGALGRKYQLVPVAHTGTPAAALAAVGKLVDQQGVAFFTGMSNSAISLAILSRLPNLNALFLEATAASDDLTGKACTPNYFRVTVNDSITVGGLRTMVKDSGASPGIC